MKREDDHHLIRWKKDGKASYPKGWTKEVRYFAGDPVEITFKKKLPIPREIDEFPI